MGERIRVRNSQSTIQETLEEWDRTREDWLRVVEHVEDVPRKVRVTGGGAMLCAVYSLYESVAEYNWCTGARGG